MLLLLLICVIVHTAGAAAYVISRLTNVPAKLVYSKNRFLLCGNFTDSYHKMLIRYITAYDE